MTYYYVKVETTKPEKRSWTAVWNGVDLIDEPRTEEEFSKAALDKGYDVSYFDLYTYGISYRDSTRIRLTAMMKAMASGAVIDNVYTDMQVYGSVKVVLR